MPIAPGKHDGITGVTFSSGGHRLLGTLYLASGSEPKPTALLLHGCPGLQQNGDLAVALRDRGWNALIFHYRGSWGSGGRYDLRTIPADVTAAVDELSCGAHPQVDPRRLAVVGHSLGGWAAVLAGARDPRLRAVAACAAAVEFGALDLGPAGIEREFTRFLAVTPEEFRRQRDEVAVTLDPLAAVAAIAPRPLLVVHGTADRWVPVTQARRLAARAGQPVRYVEIDGDGHDFAWQRSYFRELVTGWLDEIRI
jgi:uncharacterized protein